MKQKGFTLLELCISLLVIFILYGVLSFYLGRLAESSERAAVYGVLGQLQQQISLKLARYYIAGTPHEAEAMINQNPFTWMPETLANYGGEISDANEVKEGFWYFDPTERQMVYFLQRNEFLRVEELPSKELKFMLKLTGVSADNIGSTHSYGVKIDPVKPFTWDFKSSY